LGQDSGLGEINEPSSIDLRFGTENSADDDASTSRQLMPVSFINDEKLAILEAWEAELREQSSTPAIVDMFGKVVRDRNIREAVMKHPAFSHFTQPTSPSALLAATESAIDDIDSTGGTISDDEARAPSLCPLSDEDDEPESSYCCETHVCQQCGHTTSLRSEPQQIPSRRRPRSSSTNSTTSTRSCGSAGSPPRNLPVLDDSPPSTEEESQCLEQRNERVLQYTICFVGLVVAVCLLVGKGFNINTCKQAFMACCTTLVHQAGKAIQQR